MPTRYVTIAGRRVIDPRNTRAWRALVAIVVREEPTCWLRLEGCTIVSTTGDHVIPVTERPDLALVRANVHGACGSCNYKRGNLAVTDLAPTDAVRPAALSIFD